MRKFGMILSLMMLCLFGLNIQWLWSVDSFKFPSTIRCKVLKNNQVTGSCEYHYLKSGKFPDTFTLKLINFEGMGLSSNEWLLTYIFTKNASICASYVMKGDKATTEIRLKKGMGFDGRMGNVFIYKDLTSPDQIQTELLTQYPVIDLVSSFYVASQKISAGNRTKAEKFNFLFGKSTKIMDMVNAGTESVPFQGANVSTNVIVIRCNNVEIFRLKIFQDPSGYTFPLSVSMVTDYTDNHYESFEMRAVEVKY